MSNPRPQPVSGDIIGRSIAKTLGWIIVWIAAILFGIVLITVRVKGEMQEAEAEGPRITLYGLILGVGLVLFSPVAIYFQLRTVWIRRRLVIGIDRIQIIERHAGADVVKLQMPFANIAHVAYEATNEETMGGMKTGASGPQVVIDLQNPDDPESYIVDEVFNFQQHMEHYGHHFYIAETEAFRGSLKWIAGEIQGAMKTWALNKLGDQQGMELKLGAIASNAADTAVQAGGPRASSVQSHQSDSPSSDGGH